MNRTVSLTSLTTCGSAGGVYQGSWGWQRTTRCAWECHGSNQQVADAASAMDLKLTAERIERLVKHPAEPGNAHTGIACVDCHPKASEISPADTLKQSPCGACHEDALNRSIRAPP